MKASIAIQVLPQGVEETKLLEIVDEVIAYIAASGLTYVVGPFETVIEGDRVDDLLEMVKDIQRLAIEKGAKGLATYMKLWYSPKGVLTIDEKTKKFQH